jgi:phosphohistidine phosphatase
MQRQLVLMRHGHAQENRDDFARRLTDMGRTAARRAGEALRHAGFSPQRILTSPAPRAQETAQIVAEACGFRGALQAEAALYLTEVGPYLEALRRLPSDAGRVLLVGHNPTLSGLARELGARVGDLGPADYAELHLDLDGWPEL